MKDQRGTLPGTPPNDNARSGGTSPSTRSTRRWRRAWRLDVRRLIEPGKLADLVLWKPAYFGIKPEIVIKAGVIAWAQMGDPNASIPTPQPSYMRPQFGALGGARAANCLTFVSAAALDRGDVAHYRVARTLAPVTNCRHIGKRDMRLNDACPDIAVDPETYAVTADGVHLTCEPAEQLPLAQRYCLF
jgi:urease subunit alpha